jgi:hypothetical protein
MLVLVVYTLYFCSNSKGPRFDSSMCHIFFQFTFFLFYRISCNSINKNKKKTLQYNTNGCLSQWFTHFTLVPKVSGSIPKRAFFCHLYSVTLQYGHKRHGNGVIKMFDPRVDIFLPFIFCDAQVSSQKICKWRHKTYKK